MIRDDHEAWEGFPKFRHWFNKLDLALHLGYVAGPAGVPVPDGGRYITRPIYNLRGMGLGVQFHTAAKGDCPGRPGDFWCEAFDGERVSLDLRPGRQWHILRAEEALGGEPGRPTAWRRVESPELPINIYKLDGLRQQFDGDINVEMVGGKIVEVHLRTNPDPRGRYVYPVFKDKPCEGLHHGAARYVEAPEDCDGWLLSPREGFYIID